MSSNCFALTLHHLLLFLYVYAADSANGHAHYYITPSLSVVCPGDPCLTLAQLAANSTSYFGNKTNISLSFLPGNHCLDGELSLSHADNFSMTKVVGGNYGTVSVECGSQSGRFNISEMTFAAIKDLHFVGCGGNKVSQVKQFIVEDTIFEGVEGRGTALVLNQVTDASVAKSSFLSNLHARIFEYHAISRFVRDQEILKYLYLNQNPSLAVGGALYTAFSNVSIINSNFTDNRAEIGGALFAHNSSLHIVGSTYNHNKASFAGVMITSESSIKIKNSNFIDNAATFHSGVMIAYRDSFSIHSTTFTNNSAGASAGVMLTFESIFSITDNTFSDNKAAHRLQGHGGVMYTSDSSFNIANSNFTNSAANRGGVMYASDSSFNIISSNFTNSAANRGGVMYTSDSSFDITSSTFTGSSAAIFGGILFTFHSSFDITSSTFTGSSADIFGGTIATFDSSLNITSSNFTSSAANRGGVMYTSDSSFNIASSTFTNSEANRGGVMYSASDSSFNIINSTFTGNSAANFGGTIATFCSSLNIISSNFANSVATHGGVMYSESDSSFKITSSTFTNNSAANRGGVIHTSDSSFKITSSTFTGNSAANRGGVILTLSSDSLFNITSSNFTNSAAVFGGILYTSDSSFNIVSSIFTNSSAGYGGVMFTSGSSFDITSSTFTNNRARYGGVMWFSTSLFTSNITSSIFTGNSATISGGVMHSRNSLFNIIGCSYYANKANSYGGIFLTVGSATHISDGTFNNNSGSLYIFDSNLTFTGYTRIENYAKQSTAGARSRIEGGAITSFQSTVIFTGVSSLSNNQARHGGAILATESKIVMYGETIIANNTATAKVSSGGSISLQQSDLEVRGNCIISGNNAIRGGGIHATSSTIAVYQPWTLQLVNNRATNGSGLYLELNAKLYVLKSMSSFYNHSELIQFQANCANYGGAIYVADDTNAGTCSPDNECFIQVIILHGNIGEYVLINIHFSGNTASEQGPNIFGGLLDRCIPNQFAEVYGGSEPLSHYYGVSYIRDIANITALGTISSLPVRVCFCKSESEPDCSYQPPITKVKKGEAFTVPLVVVDQVNHSVDANIISSLSSQDGGFSEGQQIQSVRKNCSNVTFNVFSPHNSEIINLFADGPCGSSKLSIRHLYIEFSDCICPVGFQSLDSDTRCGCDCNSKLSPHITSCNSTTKSLVRVNTNSWITHINDTDPPGYVIHPNCPLDYCQPPTENVSMNLNLPDGSDAQCAYNRSGILCGSCQEHLSLSLGSSRCLSCHSHWPAVLVVILLAATIAGILLVTALLALNMTVAIGLINGFILYANIVVANNAIFFPSSEPSFPTVFVAWLNLDIGIDVCFFDGLDTYTKTWLQLAFPIYIISLVIIMIIVSEYSPRFAGLIGKRDPIATLATLILLSYAKLLSVTITALSFAVLDYPDGSRETVWLPDGNVPYLRGKHVALVFVALLIVLVGVPYTILLFLWQWLVRAPAWKVFKWTRNTKLNAFVSVHHVPYNTKYRYWTGLLLLVRVVLYVTASVTVSTDPQTSLLITIIIVGCLFVIKVMTGARVYKKSFLSIIETVLYFNLLALSAFSWYRFKVDIEKQTAVAYTSTIITFILLVGVIIYHVYLLVRKGNPRPGKEEHEYPLAPVQPAKDEVTYSVVEISNPRDQSPPPVENNYQIVVREITCTATPEYY